MTAPRGRARAPGRRPATWRRRDRRAPRCPRRRGIPAGAAPPCSRCNPTVTSNQTSDDDQETLYYVLICAERRNPALARPAVAKVRVNMSKALAGLFPTAVAAAELDEPGEPSSLLPAEARALGRLRARAGARVRGGASMRPARAGAVRHRGLPVLVAPRPAAAVARGLRRQHHAYARFCAAVVGERSRFVGPWGSIARRPASVERGLWPSICGPQPSWPGSARCRARSGRAAAHAAVLGQGGVLQMPVSLDRRAARISRPRIGAARLGRGAGNISTGRPGARRCRRSAAARRCR